jgi:hypothetical protein
MGSGLPLSRLYKKMALAACAWRPGFAGALFTMTQAIRMDQARRPEPMRGARWIERSTKPVKASGGGGIKRLICAISALSYTVAVVAAALATYGRAKIPVAVRASELWSSERRLRAVILLPPLSSPRLGILRRFPRPA